jgi:hypothetical protein
MSRYWLLLLAFALPLSLVPGEGPPAPAPADLAGKKPKNVKLPPDEGFAVKPPKPPKAPPDEDALLDKIIDSLSKPKKKANPDKPGKDPFAGAARVFRKLDRNGDGYLDLDEMPTELLADRARWDTNGDGRIDEAEYTRYFAARLRIVARDRGIDLPGGPPAIVPPVPESGRPVVYRPGRLPPGLPAWFEQLDTDGDGQLGLYEWQQGGRDEKEFLALDLNGDGFVTVEELLRAQKRGVLPR